jgi:hypothetical protein
LTCQKKHFSLSFQVLTLEKFSNCVCVCCPLLLILPLNKTTVVEDNNHLLSFSSSSSYLLHYYYLIFLINRSEVDDLSKKKGNKSEIDDE